MSNPLPFKILVSVGQSDLVTFVAMRDGNATATERYHIGNGRRRREVAEIWAQHPKLTVGCPITVEAIVSELEAAELRAQHELDNRRHQSVEQIDPELDQTEVNAKGEKGPSQSELLVRLALERYRIGRDDRDEAFAVPQSGPNVALMFRGSRDALRAGLSKQFRQVHHKTPNAGALADALTNLQGEALDTVPEPTFLRIADGPDGSIILDLATADGRAIRISTAGWVVLDQSPVLFRRTALSAPLPVPERSGCLDALRTLLNVTDETWPLVVGFLVAAFIPSIAHPIMMIGGEAGSGKSTAARLLVSLFDASTAPLRSQPGDVEQWCIAANGSYGVVIDNISGIRAWWSDSLCKSATGDGWVRRKLYTDGELSVTSFRRVVILTSIDAGALRGDLGDRLLLCELERIPDERRRSEVDLLEAFATRSPAILGALLDLVAEVLRELPSVQLSAGPRMMDFARVLAAVDRVRGTESLRLYQEQRDTIAADVVEADEVAKAVVEFMDDRDEWSGITRDLLAAVTPGSPSREWPRTARGFSAKLKHAAPALLRLNIEIVRPDRASSKKRDRRLIIRKNSGLTVQTVRTREDGSLVMPGGSCDRTVSPPLSDCLLDATAAEPGPQDATMIPPVDDPDDLDGLSGNSLNGSNLEPDDSDYRERRAIEDVEREAEENGGGD